MIPLYLPYSEDLSIIFFALIVFLSLIFFMYAVSKNETIRELNEKNKELELKLNIETIKAKEVLDNRFSYLKDIIDITYRTCDNPPKYKEKIGSKLLEDMKNGVLKTFVEDIIFVTNQYSHGAFENLRKKFSLTHKELRLCCLLYWGFNGTQICTLENITDNAYYVKFYRLRDKFGLAKKKDIAVFLKNNQVI